MAIPNNIIEIVKEDKVICSNCSTNAKSIWFVVRDTKPYKMITLINCPKCGTTDKSQMDYEILPFGVKIECTFSSKAEINRICFLNNDSEISILRNGELLIEFRCEDSFVDCIESLILRAQEFVEASSLEDSNVLKYVHSKLIECQNDGIVEIKIDDNSGYSKVCPVGIEYTECQDWSIERLTEALLAESIGRITHEKIDKKQ